MRPPRPEGTSVRRWMPGNSFMYYGEEIGTTQDAQAEGDEPKREPMIWDSDDLPEITVNNKLGADPDHAPYGGVKQQEIDKNSILSYYKRVIKIKNQNPGIARGTITEELDLGDGALCAYVAEYEGEKLAIVHNLSFDETKTAQADIFKTAELRGDLIASNGEELDGEKLSAGIELKDGTLTLPPYSTAVLKLK